MAWLELQEKEYDVVWDRFYDQFSFRPSTKPEDWPGIREPMPSVTYSIAGIYGDPIRFLALLQDLNLNALRAFREVLRPDQRLYALEWQSTSYWFFPHQEFSAEIAESWLIPPLPNGDYYIFLEQDFGFGWFGHPWEKTICVFGEPLLSSVERFRPRIFAKAVRRDGKQI
jgi:uncharacterized protein DUF2716